VLVDPKWVPRLPARRYEERVMLATSVSFDVQRSRLSCQIVVTPELEGLHVNVAPDDP
jgi:2Fe-2S ferredoxin